MKFVRSMDIYSRSGTIVRFLNQNGYEHERDTAAISLTEGVDYEVEHIDVGNWSSRVKLVGIDGWWNTVMFATPAAIEAFQHQLDRDKEEEMKEDPEKKAPWIVTVIEHHQHAEDQAAERNQTLEEFREEFRTDEDFNNYLCSGDYWGYSVLIGDEEVASYGDSYHDKGREKAGGFVDGLRYLHPDIVVEYKYIADMSY